VVKRLWIVAIVFAALHAGAGEISDAMRRFVEPGLPAKIQNLTCPETAEETKNLFWCTGALVDNRWFDVLAKRKPDLTVEVIDLIYYPPTGQALASAARKGVTSDFRTVDCPRDAGVNKPQFECKGVLVDGSRLTIRAERFFQRIAPEPFIWDPASPSPLITIVRSAAPEGAIESITCPEDLTGTFDCTVHYTDRKPASYTIRHDGNAFSIVADLQRQHERYQVIGAIAIAVGVFLIIAAAAWLISLNIGSVVARLPFAEVQPVELPEAGSYVLHIELPYFTWLPRLQYAMADAGGREIPMLRDLFPTHSSFAKVRRSVRLFSVDAPGKYNLRTSGTQPDRDVSQWGLIITRSFMLRGLLCALMIVAGALTVLAGAVLFIS